MLWKCIIHVLYIKINFIHAILLTCIKKGFPWILIHLKLLYLSFGYVQFQSIKPNLNSSIIKIKYFDIVCFTQLVYNLLNVFCIGQSSYSSDEDVRDRSIRSGVRKARGRLWKKMHPGYTYSSDDIDLIGKHGYGRGCTGSNWGIKYCKPIFIRMWEIFWRLARASLLRIILTVNQWSNVGGKLFFR